jgi:hypothetical protein
MTEEKIADPSAEQSVEYKDSLTRLKEARALKKEKKKAVKAVVQKFGDVKLAKKLVKGTVRRMERTRAAGRGR